MFVHHEPWALRASTAKPSRSIFRLARKLSHRVPLKAPALRSPTSSGLPNHVGVDQVRHPGQTFCTSDVVATCFRLVTANRTQVAEHRCETVSSIISNPKQFPVVAQLSNRHYLGSLVGGKLQIVLAIRHPCAIQNTDVFDDAKVRY